MSPKNLQRPCPSAGVYLKTIWHVSAFELWIDAFSKWTQPPKRCCTCWPHWSWPAVIFCPIASTRNQFASGWLAVSLLHRPSPTNRHSHHLHHNHHTTSPPMQASWWSFVTSVFCGSTGGWNLHLRRLIRGLTGAPESGSGRVLEVEDVGPFVGSYSGGSGGTLSPPGNDSPCPGVCGGGNICDPP